MLESSMKYIMSVVIFFMSCGCTFQPLIAIDEGGGRVDK